MGWEKASHQVVAHGGVMMTATDYWIVIQVPLA